MDLVRFGEDYQDHFDPKAYLNESYKGEGHKVDPYKDFPLRCFHEFWSKMAKKNLRVLDFGGGPCIYDLISAAPNAEEIIFAEYCEKSRQAVETWLEKSPDAHDWLPYFKFVVEMLEEKESEEVFIRESELRKKIRHILPCDVGCTDPVKWPSTWSSQTATFDVVTTSLCLEAAVKSLSDYSQAIAKISNYLKPGGTLVMYSTIGDYYYTVGSETFHFFPVTEKEIKDILCKQGFTELEMKLDKETAFELYFLSAKKV